MYKNKRIKKRPMPDKIQEVNLKEYYYSLPEKEIIAQRKSLLADIARVCGVEINTVYGWLVGGVPVRHQERVARVIDRYQKNREGYGS